MACDDGIEIGCSRGSSTTSHAISWIGKKSRPSTWNLLGVRVLKQIPTGLGVPVRAGGSIGFATLSSGVGYEFVMTGRLEADLWQRKNAGVYLRLGARLVALDPEEPLLRGNFVDLMIETGGRLARGDRDGRAVRGL